MEESKTQARRARGSRGRGHGKAGDRMSRGNNRGGHGRGGKPYDRPVDAREYQNRPANGSRRGNRGGRGFNRPRGSFFRGPRQIQNRPMQIKSPKDSYYYKYFYGPYPELEEMEVTLDTEIPKIKDEDLRKEPEKEEYAKHMKECDDKIQDLRSKITAINDQKRAVLTNRKQESGKDNEIEVEGKNFKQLVSEKRALVDERKELNTELDKQNDVIGKPIDLSFTVFHQFVQLVSLTAVINTLLFRKNQPGYH